MENNKKPLQRKTIRKLYNGKQSENFTMENNKKTLQLKTITKSTMEYNKKPSWDHDPFDCSKQEKNKNQQKNFL